MFLYVVEEMKLVEEVLTAFLFPLLFPWHNLICQQLFVMLKLISAVSFSFMLAGMDLFSNCTEECKALGHSDRCWMPSFVPSDGRQAADYRSNLHVPGMDSVPDTEVFETPEAQPGAERSFSTFGKEKALHNSLERKEFDGLLSNTRAPYKPPYLSKYCSKSSMGAFPLWQQKLALPAFPARNNTGTILGMGGNGFSRIQALFSVFLK